MRDDTSIFAVLKILSIHNLIMKQISEGETMKANIVPLFAIGVIFLFAICWWKLLRKPVPLFAIIIFPSQTSKFTSEVCWIKAVPNHSTFSCYVNNFISSAINVEFH